MKGSGTVLKYTNLPGRKESNVSRLHLGEDLLVLYYDLQPLVHGHPDLLVVRVDALGPRSERGAEIWDVERVAGESVGRDVGDFIFGHFPGVAS